MGQAKRKKELGIQSKRYRFMTLLKMISPTYTEDQIKMFANRRFKPDGTWKRKGYKGDHKPLEMKPSPAYKKLWHYMALANLFMNK